MLMEDRVKGASHRPLRLCKALALCVRRIAHQRQHALFAKLRKSLQIDRLSVYRRIIHLEVARMDHRSRRGMDRKRSRIHDTVVRLDKFDPELSQIDRLAELDHLALRVPEKVMLPQLILDQSHRQSRRIDRNIQLAQHIRQRADVILMSVRDHKALYPVHILLQISYIRNHQIDSQHVVIGE